jgi:hypothetical protein
MRKFYLSSCISSAKCGQLTKLLISRIITFNNPSSDVSFALLEINQLSMEDSKIEKYQQPAESYIKEIKRETMEERRRIYQQQKEASSK